MDGSRRGPAKAVEAKDPRFAPLKRFLLSDIDVGDAAIAVSQQLSHVDGTNDGGGNHQFSPPKEITLGPAADAVNSGYVADPKDTFDRLAELSALRKGGHVELDDHIWHQISEEARKEAFDSTPYFLALLEQNGWSRANGGVFQTQVTAIQDGVEQVVLCPTGLEQAFSLRYLEMVDLDADAGFEIEGHCRVTRVQRIVFAIALFLNCHLVVDFPQAIASNRRMAAEFRRARDEWRTVNFRELESNLLDLAGIGRAPQAEAMRLVGIYLNVMAPPDESMEAAGAGSQRAPWAFAYVGMTGNPLLIRPFDHVKHPTNEKSSIISNLGAHYGHRSLLAIDALYNPSRHLLHVLEGFGIAGVDANLTAAGGINKRLVDKNLGTLLSQSDVVRLYSAAIRWYEHPMMRFPPYKEKGAWEAIFESETEILQKVSIASIQDAVTGRTHKFLYKYWNIRALLGNSFQIVSVPRRASSARKAAPRKPSAPRAALKRSRSEEEESEERLNAAIAASGLGRRTRPALSIWNK